MKNCVEAPVIFLILRGARGTERERGLLGVVCALSLYLSIYLSIYLSLSHVHIGGAKLGCCVRLWLHHGDSCCCQERVPVVCLSVVDQWFIKGRKKVQIAKQFFSGCKIERCKNARKDKSSIKSSW